MVPPLQVMKTMVDYGLPLNVLTTSITVHELYVLSSDFNVPGVNWVDFNYLRSELSQAANLFNTINDAICFIM